MKNEIPLTMEQRLFAAEHHDLVYKYLHKRQLSIDEFYDVVIFAYLRSVRRYLTEPALENYSFTTIAWKAMNNAVYNYYRSQRNSKHNAFIYSLHSRPYPDNLSLEETIAAPDPLMRQLEDRLFFHDLAKRLSKQQMDVVYLKSCGYDDHDIARNQNTTLHHIQNVLKNVRHILVEICCE